jgi:hypothetical protein
MVEGNLQNKGTGDREEAARRYAGNRKGPTEKSNVPLSVGLVFSVVTLCVCPYLESADDAGSKLVGFEFEIISILCHQADVPSKQVDPGQRCGTLVHSRDV